ncbi:MAG TPA: baseplate J/gp47 family protein [Kofleriaceae bacterium]|nr:baseplate J/gp47 family protein [Kofleriaceae bacterium]
MAFRTPTLDEQHATLIAVSKALQPDIDVSDTSTENLWLLTQAAGVTDNHANVAAAKNDLLPQTASGEMLDRWADLRGVRRKGATPARKAAALRVFGTPTTTVDDGTTFRHVSGLRFKTTNGDELVGPSGYVDCDVVAIDKGSATRLNAGETLTIETPVTGLEDEAELQKDLDEDGEDAEQDGALSPRVVSRFRDPPRGGTRVDYEQWALEIDGIAAAYPYPLRGGNGTVHLAALHAGSGAARILDSVEISDLQALIDAKKRPVSVKGFTVLKVVEEPTDVEVTVLPDGEPEHEFDWDDTTPPVVLSWNAGTRTLTFATDRPPSMAAGHRIAIDPASGSGGTGAERVIESLSSTDAVVLEADDDGDTPVATDTVYAGGPLVEPIRQAIIGLIDALGTANPDAHRYGTWEGNLRPIKIGSAAGAVDGVLEVAVAVPAATVEASDPAYPDNGEVGLITPGRILVRRAH